MSNKHVTMIAGPVYSPPGSHARKGAISTPQRVVGFALLALILAGAILSAQGASANVAANKSFYETWARTDDPVANNKVSRTWMWGPEAFTVGIEEPYAESPDGHRVVQYFDKSRMETNEWADGQPTGWYVTNGLLVMELISGRIQLGNDSFHQDSPAQVNVAGDSDDPTGPTYASFTGLLDVPGVPAGSAVTRKLDRSGAVTVDESLAARGITIGAPDEMTGFGVASPFWDFMTSKGLVYQDGGYATADLFTNPYFATGRPITLPYWITVKVGGTYEDVLVQAFERRVMTYTPDNPDGWKVEAGNVGRHYHAWRYGSSEPTGHEMLFSIPVGPEGLEYRFGNKPTPELVNYGPNAITMAPDGTFWIADAAGKRLVHYSATGQKLNVIDLLQYDAASVFDVEASTGDVWVLFGNLDLGVFRLGQFIPEGQLLRMYDLHEDPAVSPYIGYSPGITITDGGEVVIQAVGGEVIVRVVAANGDQDNTDLTELMYDGRSYSWRYDAMTKHVLIVDETEIIIQARSGDFAMETGLIDQVSGDTFSMKIVYVPDATGVPFLHTVERISFDGERLGVAELPTEERFVYVQFDLVTGSDGNVYQLMTYPDRIDVLKLAFDPVN